MSQIVLNEHDSSFILSWSWYDSIIHYWQLW